MENIQPETGKVIRISKKKSLITVIILAVIILITLGLYRMLGTTYGGVRSYNSIALPTVPSGGINGGYYPEPYYNNQPDITDTREFLKTSYSAQIKTREVSSIITNIKNAVKGAEGRVDNINTSEKSGYISFVVPKTNFDEFKNEVQNIAGAKLYTENISSQNLLGEKQGIEQQGQVITQSLADLQKSKKILDSKHTAIIKSITNDLVNVEKELANVRLMESTTEDPTDLSQLRSQESEYIHRESILKQNQDAENKSYALESNSLQNQIAQANNNLTNNIKQDTTFTNNIETINGYINVNWVSLWEMAKIFSPIHPTIIVIILVLLILYFLKRIKVIPKIQFV